MDKHFEIGNELYKKQEYVKAIKKFEEVELESQYYIKALYNKGVCLTKLKHYEKGIEALKGVVKRNDIHQKSIYNIGFCYKKLGEVKKALIYFKSALALNNDDIDSKKAVELIEGFLLFKGD